ncbi:MAG TPA: sigma-54 dependent transcriptional regulator [Flavobacteriales bacterium]|jgi:two-component system nitrogen regulation response regulator NtrX|nr:sigma-54-dependent Fis family transcriptional regulator [Flavobacteriales bacterium]MBK7102090.1 sigma-54-dependent Fis family transcriptional regulator [Flavobacteriales bacterium]MBK7112560.1 sigma-54-dependent Fis family transcriptional regulator [Flavobacteriales bacterium]MBK7483498.1 sigma-54-dependent Fis family transcriptional regulator [Flavobacteriales bacterium]MBK8531517.1 sigma-54-dependent Fis family transcriptional regulator [Flavobacteriales bacterium]
MAKILVVDDEKAIRNALRDILEHEKHTVDEAEDGSSALDKAKKGKFDLVLCDIKMPKMDGLEFLQKITAYNDDLPVIMISGHGTIDTAVEALKKGAFDFIEKPPNISRILVSVRNALDRGGLVQETKILRTKAGKSKGSGVQMVGESKALEAIREMIEKVAPSDARVLITGGNGAGKEGVARLLHEKSQRVQAPFVEVNCAAIPGELIESELFGHVKGSFTSAIKDRKGKFELADGGTLFLDEIGDMSLAAQAKVLRALQESRITPVGGDKDITVNVRVIAATNKDLKKEIEAGNFREDLFHRLSVIPIHVPSLSERTEDIPLLADHFIQQVCTEQGIAPKAIADKAVKELQKLPWTGNVRELRNVIERLVILSGKEITEGDVKAFAVPRA